MHRFKRVISAGGFYEHGGMRIDEGGPWVHYEDVKELIAREEPPSPITESPAKEIHEGSRVVVNVPGWSQSEHGKVVYIPPRDTSSGKYRVRLDPPDMHTNAQYMDVHIDYITLISSRGGQEGDQCQRCGEYGDDRRNIRMACPYDMSELGIPFTKVKMQYAVGLEGQIIGFYTLCVCKKCRASWMQAVKDWWEKP